MAVSRASKGHSHGAAWPSIWKGPLLWLNLVCLDAPLVAITWQWLFARAFHAEVPWADAAALFLAAWLIYLVDRLIDSLVDARETEKRRDAFCATHLRLWVALIVCAAVAEAAVLLLGFDRSMVKAGIILAAMVGAYLLINLWFGRVWRVLPLKEVTIGYLFAAGTVFSIWWKVRATPEFVVAFILFGCLCTLNCMLIALWEKPLDAAAGRHSVATRWPQAGGTIRQCVALLVFVSNVLLLMDPSLWVLAICLSISFSLLFLLHYAGLGRDERTAGADLALLTPLLVMLIDSIL